MTTCPKPENLLEQLRAFEIFADVSDAALKWLIDNSTYHCLEKNEYFVRSDEPVHHMQVVLTGGYVIRRESKGRKREMGVWEAPMVAGLLPFSRMTTSAAEGVTTAPTSLLQLHKDHFTEMVNQSYPLTQALVGVMTNRVRDFQQMQLMDEKLMALGKMSAGLAHELNNPASAMIRSAQELHRHLQQTPERIKALFKMRVSDSDVDKMNDVLFERIAAKQLKPGEDLSLIEREELIDELQDWCEDHDIKDCEEIVDTLIDWGFESEHLDLLAKIVTGPSLQAVLWWLEASLTTESLVDEIQTASTRISELVTSIKTYSHMDSDPSMEFIDVHEGLISTLTMLKFKFKKDKSIGFRKEWDRTLPFIKALPGELNQVWTNLIVNALDALEGQEGAQLTIRTYKQRENLCIDIEDNGPGIPADIQSRVFEPFFTTKGIGEGTGMGLDIVRRVLERHSGSIGMESEPGRTCFRVCFPL
ncbi:GHKL domain-containing protein [Neolewinella aurantiaca]|uniref:histidine kinase n=1 Tax=Neolewinella aurantiaca TaxID=2602767 RepID=A0A5C7FPX8_9BACT|nr:ATP-binding protein [Neolewinella aurantiaca]TXF88499.1 GHKL domain-containing protein [Neolewinella aurantiaca]